MPANPAYNDGGAEYGSAVLSITPKGGGQAWSAICDGDFTLAQTTRRVVRYNQYGEPTGQFGIADEVTGNCTIYLPTGKKVGVGDTFTADVTDNKVWIVTEVETPYASADWRKQTIRFVEKLAS